MTIQNAPSLWLSQIPLPALEGHKYDRGGVVVFGGTEMTGAARLAITAAMRIGAGVGIISAPKQALSVYRSASPAHIIVERFHSVAATLKDARRKAIVIGPGLGTGSRKKVLAVLKTKRPTVLDADALNAFEGDSAALLKTLHDSCVLTPHEGEFGRLFPSLTGTREERASKAADLCGAVVVLKGAGTIIAAPNTEPICNTVQSSWLATAGSGDVLAGMIGGLLAQGMNPHSAACAAVYIHAVAGNMYGRGLVASDLPDVIPFVLRDLK